MNRISYMQLRKYLRAFKPNLRENLGLKVISLLFALGMYAYVHGAQDAHRSINVDLVALLPGADHNRILLTDLPATVRVNVHGPRSLVAELHSRDMGNLQLDLRGDRSGHIVLTPDMLSVPGGVVVDSIEPPYLDIVWDEIVQRRIPVRVSVTGTPPEGLLIKSRPTALPDTVLARGPKQVVEGLQFASAEAFDVTGLKEGTHKRTLPLDRPPRRVSYRPTAVTVRVTISQKTVEKLFSNVPVQLVGAPDNTKVVPPRVDIRVKGPSLMIKQLRVEQVVPRVSLEGIDRKKNKHDSRTKDVQVDLDKVDVTVIPKKVVVKW